MKQLQSIARKILVVTVIAGFSAPELMAAENDSLKKTIEKILQVQTAAWNRGDIEGFMDTYWKSEELTFSSGGTTTRGWQATLDRYKKRYHPSSQMGKLKFDHLEVNRLNEQSAFVLGRWNLEKDGKTKTGNFTLVIRQIEQKWLIVHDHSSIEEKEK